MSEIAPGSVFEFLADGFIDAREISKGGPDASEVHVMGTASAPRAKSLAPMTRRARRVALPAKAKENNTADLSKSDVSEVTWTAEISKVDEDKRQVFGWCSLSKVNGEPVVDRQNDFVPLDEIEKSAYKYVLESRKGGDMHKRQMKKGLMGSEDEPVHTADLIESFVVTPEKLKQMGLDEDALPHGWWVGFKVNDEDQWQMVKDGKRTGFSIHGSGKRSPGVI